MVSNSELQEMDLKQLKRLAKESVLDYQKLKRKLKGKDDKESYLRKKLSKYVTQTSTPSSSYPDRDELDCGMTSEHCSNKGKYGYDVKDIKKLAQKCGVEYTNRKETCKNIASKGGKTPRKRKTRRKREKINVPDDIKQDFDRLAKYTKNTKKSGELDLQKIAKFFGLRKFNQDRKDELIIRIITKEKEYGQFEYKKLLGDLDRKDIKFNMVKDMKEKVAEKQMEKVVTKKSKSKSKKKSKKDKVVEKIVEKIVEDKSDSSDSSSSSDESVEDKDDRLEQLQKILDNSEMEPLHIQHLKEQLDSNSMCDVDNKCSDNKVCDISAGDGLGVCVDNSVASESVNWLDVNGQHIVGSKKAIKTLRKKLNLSKPSYESSSERESLLGQASSLSEFNDKQLKRLSNEQLEMFIEGKTIDEDSEDSNEKEELINDLISLEGGNRSQYNALSVNELISRYNKALEQKRLDLIELIVKKTGDDKNIYLEMSLDDVVARMDELLQHEDIKVDESLDDYRDEMIDILVNLTGKSRRHFENMSSIELERAFEQSNRKIRHTENDEYRDEMIDILVNLTGKSRRHFENMSSVKLERAFEQSNRKIRTSNPKKSGLFPKGMFDKKTKSKKLIDDVKIEIDEDEPSSDEPSSDESDEEPSSDESIKEKVVDESDEEPSSDESSESIKEKVEEKVEEPSSDESDKESIKEKVEEKIVEVEEPSSDESSSNESLEQDKISKKDIDKVLDEISVDKNKSIKNIDKVQQKVLECLGVL